MDLAAAANGHTKQNRGRRHQLSSNAEHEQPNAFGWYSAGEAGLIFVGVIEWGKLENQIIWNIEENSKIENFYLSHWLF